MRMTRIDKFVFLGSRDDAQDVDFVRNNQITSIITVDDRPLKLDVTQGLQRYKHLHALDDEEFDIIGIFPEALEFIIEGTRNKENTLVHCLQGESRSVTIVLAFIMAAHHMSLTEAWNMCRKHPTIRPNDGFVQQLLLWQRMGCKIDPEFPPYQLYRMKFLQQAIENAAADAYRADPAASSNQSHLTIYRCRKCRRALFPASAVYSHERGVGEVAFSWRRPVTDSEAQALGEESEVSMCHDSLFIEPVKWMDGLLHELTGKLLCPKCSAKLGSFTWMGERCPCGSWVTPAFHIQTGKVDLCKPRTAITHQ